MKKKIKMQLFHPGTRQLLPLMKPDPLNWFHVFRLGQPHVLISLPQLRQQQHKWMRQVHPDVCPSPHAVDWSAFFNFGYQTLIQPHLRVRHVMELRHIPVHDVADATTSQLMMDMLLMLQSKATRREHQVERILFRLAIDDRQLSDNNVCGNISQQWNQAYALLSLLHRTQTHEADADKPHFSSNNNNNNNN